MLFHMYQVFSSLHGHLQFFVHFFFTFMEHFFIDHPISHPILERIELERWDWSQINEFFMYFTTLTKSEHL